VKYILADAGCFGCQGLFTDTLHSNPKGVLKRERNTETIKIDK
jgi:hypothetical protein